MEYYHLVFTLPAPISDIAYANKSVVYGLLFQAAAETLRTIAADPKHLGARIGATLVLHTWGSAMTHHPHVHGIVPGGGVSLDGARWVACKPGFFLPVRVLSRLFRRLFLEQLSSAYQAGTLRFFGEHQALAEEQAFIDWLKPLRRCEWVVYAKRPFAGPAAVLAYLARYTHRVAIANSRLIAMDEHTCSWATAARTTRAAGWRNMSSFTAAIPLHAASQYWFVPVAASLGHSSHHGQFYSLYELPDRHPRSVFSQPTAFDLLMAGYCIQVCRTVQTLIPILPVTPSTLVLSPAVSSLEASQTPAR